LTDQLFARFRNADLHVQITGNTHPTA